MIIREVAKKYNAEDSWWPTIKEFSESRAEKIGLPKGTKKKLVCIISKRTYWDGLTEVEGDIYYDTNRQR